MMETRVKNRIVQTLLLTGALLLALFLVSAVGAQDAPAATSSATLTLSMTTTPAGGQGFWLSAVSFQTSWGQLGKGNGQYRQPRDIDRDADGNFYVSDHRNSRIQKLSPTGAFIARIGGQTRPQGKLLRPNAIAVVGDRLYVADTDNNRIVVFSTAGAFVRAFGGLGVADGKFDRPNGVAVGPSGNVYVADTFNHRIQVFTPEGAFVSKWGTLGSGDGQLRYPAHLDFDAAGNLYVADSNNHRIQVFDGNGAFVRKFGVFGSGPGQFNVPVGVEVGEDGYLYVSEAFGNRIQKLTTTGAYVAHWSQVAGGTTISRPNGMLQTAGRLYATDLDANRIQIFAETTATLDGGQQQALTLPAGTYDVTQTPKAGWTFGSATCSGGSPTPITRGARLTLADGAAITCAFAAHQ